MAWHFHPHPHSPPLRFSMPCHHIPTLFPTNPVRSLIVLLEGAAHISIVCSEYNGGYASERGGEKRKGGGNTPPVPSSVAVVHGRTHHAMNHRKAEVGVGITIWSLDASLPSVTCCRYVPRDSASSPPGHFLLLGSRGCTLQETRKEGAS